MFDKFKIFKIFSFCYSFAKIILVMGNMKKVIIIAGGVIALNWFAGVLIYQSPVNTEKSYRSALSAMQQEKYSNAYYLFSRVSFFSNLKPIALYHQGECAAKIDDTDTAVKKYRALFKIYPKHKLSPKAKYLAAQSLVKTDPNTAKKYFDEIIEAYPHTDFAIAAEYYSGLILMNSYINSQDKIFPMSKKNDVENYFRHYLNKAPSGRLALNVVSSWLSLDKPISTDDYLLMAKSYFLFNEYKKAEELLSKVDFKESWAIAVQNAYALGNNPRVKYLVEWGLQNHAQYIDNEDIHDAVDTYLKLFSSKYEGANRLLYLANSKGKDYIWDIKCTYIDSASRSQCFKDLYLSFPDSPYVDDALSQIFLETIRKNDLTGATKIGRDFLNKFKQSDYTPMVMYWMGRIAEKKHDYSEYMGYYRSVIAKYPDNYYAYRAYLRMNHTMGALITSHIKKQPVEYPYKHKPAIVETLISLNDYEVLEEFSRGDDFLKSWIQYRKGNYSQSVVTARNAMDELSVKPDKYDYRWRLVYPLHYYDEVKADADRFGNNPPLMQSIVREESYFNPEAQSVVGALGLMQLMPATADEVASKTGISKYNLKNPNENILLGNAYYAFLKTMLSGMDISAIAAYNGGIGSVNSWKKNIYYNDTDEFVEQIPYPETKNYVKKVFRSYWNYVRIYNENN